MTEPHRPAWGFALTIGAIAFVAVGLLVLPNILNLTAPAATPLPTATADPHVVVTDAGTLAISYEDSAMVVRRTADGTTTELGRVSLPSTIVPGASAQAVSGNAFDLMTCPGASGAPNDRFVFGWQFDIRDFRYTGPPAIGQVAPDGLYLFALDAGGTTPDHITIASRSGGGDTAASEFDDLARNGEPLASGCRVE